MVGRFAKYVLIISLLLAPVTVLAQRSIDDIQEDLLRREISQLGTPDQDFAPGELPSASRTGLRSENLLQFVASLIRVFLGILGVILLVMIIYAGFLYATAAGDEERASSARNTLLYAIIGIVIIAGAWILSDYVISNVLLQE